jgi:hypothetical protein
LETQHLNVVDIKQVLLMLSLVQLSLGLQIAVAIIVIGLLKNAIKLLKDNIQIWHPVKKHVIKLSSTKNAMKHQRSVKIVKWVSLVVILLLSVKHLAMFLTKNATILLVSVNHVIQQKTKIVPKLQEHVELIARRKHSKNVIKMKVNVKHAKKELLDVLMVQHAIKLVKRIHTHRTQLTHAIGLLNHLNAKRMLMEL